MEDTASRVVRLVGAAIVVSCYLLELCSWEWKESSQVVGVLHLSVSRVPILL